MRRARRCVGALLAAALSQGCAATLRLEDVPVVGRDVTVAPEGERPKLEGELLVVSSDALYVRTKDGVRELPLREVRDVRVKRHGFGAKKALAWAVAGGVATGVGLAASCASVEGDNDCATVGLVTAGLWLLAGGLTAPALESSSRLDFPKPSADTLRPYARLPQGLPAGVTPQSLASAPPPAPGTK